MRKGKRWTAFSLAIWMLPLVGCKFAVEASPLTTLDGKIGIHLDVINGEPQPLTLSANRSGYYIEQLRLQALQLEFPAPDVLQWLAEKSEFSRLDWSGVHAVKTTWEASGTPPTYEEIRALQGAQWMAHVDHRVTIVPLDRADAPRGAPIELTAERFVLHRENAMSWSEGQPSPGNNGGNAGDYSQIAIASGGDYTGDEDDIYSVSVIEGGALDGTARVAVTSVRGDVNPVIPPGPPPKADKYLPVVSGEAIALGTQGLGATITFTEQLPNQKLVKNDRWIVRVGPPPPVEPPAQGPPPEPVPSVGPATPGTRALHSAVAEVRWMVPHFDMPPLELGADVAKLRVVWSVDGKETATYFVPVTFERSELEYGLQVDLQLSPPANGDFYERGEKFSITVELRDDAGNRLHPEGKLPTYADFRAGKANGILYYNPSGLPSGNGYFGEARTNIMSLVAFGPKQFVRLNYTNGEPEDYFRAESSFPNTGRIAVGGRRDPKLWETEIPNKVEVELPKEAKAGTYVVAVKAQRRHLGETTYRMVDAEFQVGSARKTQFEGRIGNCDVCHKREADLERMRHGSKNDRLCMACHAASRGLVVEHLHAIHFFSTQFLPPRNDCTLCHLQVGSNVRASKAVCGACHGTIHADEPLALDKFDDHAACAPSCHAGQQTGHIKLPPL